MNLSEKSRKVIRFLLKAIGTLFVITLIAVGLVWWYFHPTTEEIERVAYGQRNGVDLSYQIVRPGNPNGAAILFMVSGSWKSGPDKFEPWLAAPLLRRGFTVFAISHLSQPKATIGEITQDIEQAVRHIRLHAKEYGVDENRFGITGGSSGGHLSLMIATRGDAGDKTSDDPVQQKSSKIQAAAIFFPVTDLLNLGDSRENPGDGGPPKSYVKGFGPGATDMKKWKKIGGDLSPILHITEDLPPVLIYHGDADTLVPLDQSTRFRDRATSIGKPVELVVRKGKDHGWPTMIFDIVRFAKWFEDHLSKEPEKR